MMASCAQPRLHCNDISLPSNRLNQPAVVRRGTWLSSRTHRHAFEAFRTSQPRPGISVFAIKRPDHANAPRVKDLLRKKSSPGSSSKQGSDPHQLRMEHMELACDQAIGQIVSAQANFKKVVVLRAGMIEQDLEVMDDRQDHAKAFATELVRNNGPIPTDVRTEDTDAEGKIGKELLCVVRALLKKINQNVMVGDRVLVSSIDWIDGRAMIDHVFERKTEVLDPPVANVDQLLLLFSMDRPRTDVITLSRFLIEAESTGIPFSLLFNKADLVSFKEVSECKSRMMAWGYDPLFCSVTSKSGILPLLSVLANKISVIIGPSGVGKSSLINVLGDEAGIGPFRSAVFDKHKHFSDDVMDKDSMVMQMEGWSSAFEEQAVGEVSERSGRGKHTTRHVSLLRISSGGYLADTPGFNQPGLAKVMTKTLPDCFPEIRNQLSERGPCSFSDCLHIGEPGCVVGGDWERYPHYLQLLEEVKKREQLEMRTFGTKRESEVRLCFECFFKLLQSASRCVFWFGCLWKLAVYLAERSTLFVIYWWAERPVSTMYSFYFVLDILERNRYPRVLNSVLHLCMGFRCTVNQLVYHFENIHPELPMFS